MAETHDEETKAAPRKPGGVMMLAIIFLSIAGGSAAPFLMPLLGLGQSGKPADHTAPQDLHNTGSHESAHGGGVAYVSLGEILANLNEDNLIRYMRVVITLEVNKSDAEEVSKIVDEHRATLRNWLISRISDLRVDEVRGASNQNRLRREIQDQLNATLFPDREEGITNVLFEECNVQ